MSAAEHVNVYEGSWMAQAVTWINEEVDSDAYHRLGFKTILAGALTQLEIAKQLKRIGDSLQRLERR